MGQIGKQIIAGLTEAVAREKAWMALRERCCATKPATDATRVVMLGRDDFMAALDAYEAARTKEP